MADREPRSKQRTTFLAVSAFLVVAIIIAASDILLPFILALVVAFLLTPAVLHVERLRIPRWIAILLVYAVTIGLISVFFSFTIPSIAKEAKALQAELPNRILFAQSEWLPAIDRKLEEWTGRPGDHSTEQPEPAATQHNTPSVPESSEAAPAILIRKREDGALEIKLGDQVQFRKLGGDVWQLEQVERETSVSSQKLLERGFAKATKYLTENTVELLRLGQQIVGAVWRGVFTLFMTLMLAGYIILTHESIIQFFRELVKPARQAAFDRLLRRMERGLAGVVRGQLLICCVNGVLSAIGFWFFGLKYWPIMSLVAAIGSIIPIFGSIVSTIPAVAIGLTQSPWIALSVLIWVIGIHQLEANFLNPKIIGDAAKIHPVLVVFSLLVGEHFFHAKGALLAVPCMSIVQTIFLHFRETTMGLADPMASLAPELAGPVTMPSVPPAPRTPGQSPTGPPSSSGGSPE